MIKVMYQSKYWTEESKVRRYVVKAPIVGYRWCEQSAEDSRFDLRQGTCDREDLPPHIAEICDRHKGAFYASEWPLTVKTKGGKL